MQTWEDSKKNNFGPNFGFSNFFFLSFTSTSSWALFQVTILCNLKENQWTKLEKMAKTKFWAWFWPVWAKWKFPIIFLLVLTLLDGRYCRNLSLYAISRKTYDSNLKKGGKPHFGPDLGPLGLFSFFSKIWLCQSLAFYLKLTDLNETDNMLEEWSYFYL